MEAIIGGAALCVKENLSSGYCRYMRSVQRLGRGRMDRIVFRIKGKLQVVSPMKHENN